MPRPGKAAAEQALAARAARFSRAPTWNGLAPGDAVRIAGIRGGHWRFRCHVTNLASGATWVEVDELDVPRRASGAARRPGASAGETATRRPPVRRVRSFAEDRVVSASRRRTRRRPEADGQERFAFDLSREPDPVGEA